MGGKRTLEELLDDSTSAEEDIWAALFEPAMAIPARLATDLLEHANVSDRIIRAYFNNDIPFEWTESFDRGDLLEEQLLEWDVSTALQVEGLSLPTLTAIAREIASVYAHTAEEFENEDQDVYTLIHITFGADRALLNPELDGATDEEIRAHGRALLSISDVAKRLIELITKLDKDHEYSEWKRVEALEEWIAGVAAFQARISQQE